MNLEILEGLDLSPGTRIKQPVIEAIVGITEADNPKEFDLKRLKLKDYLEESLSQAWMADEDIKFTCLLRQDKGDLLLMGNEDVSPYATATRNKAFRRAKKLLYHLSNRDRSKLSEYEKQELDANIGYYSMTIRSHRKAMRKYPVPKPEKQTIIPPMRSFKNRDRRFG